MLMPTPGSPAKSMRRGTGAQSAARCGTGKTARGSTGDTAANGSKRPTAARSSLTTGGKLNTGSLARSKIHGSFACQRNVTTNGTGITATNYGTDSPATLNLIMRTSPAGSSTTKSGV